MTQPIPAIYVMRRHISDAERANAHKCAIAQAIVESDQDIVWANVTTKYIEFGRRSNEMRYKYRTPKPARDFVIAFDNERHPKPFRLVLRDTDFVSMRPRQMRQQQTAVQRERIRVTAAARGVAPEDVDPADVEVWHESDGVAVTPRPRKRNASPTRTNNRRTTIAEALGG